MECSKNALRIKFSVRLLLSSTVLLLNPTNFHLKSYGSQAFAVSAPELWNSLPVFIRPCDNLSSFKSKVKTHLFNKTYYSKRFLLFITFLKAHF